MWLSRRIVARIMDTFGPPLAGTHVDPVDTRTSDGRRVVGEWVYGAGVPRDRADTAIYFVHGSGYALCSPRTHRRLTSWLSRLTGLPVFSVDYRLAPRHRFPSAADDVRSGWDWLVRDGGLARGITTILAENLRYLDVRADVPRRYNERIQKRLAKTTWMSGCRSWYLPADGFNAAMYPGFATQHLRQMRDLRFADYDAVARDAHAGIGARIRT
ncbi:MAG: epsilon-lactone hydrolase [Mycobacterium sp.]|nr:epsilon-lactone hydrolase [Mycobacterium sp.]